MNKKQTIVLGCAIVWVFAMIFVVLANPFGMQLTPSQQGQSFKTLSGYAKGYLDTMQGAIKQTAPKFP